MEKDFFLSETESVWTSKSKQISVQTSRKIIPFLKWITVRHLWGVWENWLNLTWSATLIKINRWWKPIRVLIDYGMFQMKDSLMLNKKNPFNPKEIDAVIVTHAHLDHIWKLPLLINWKENKIFRWKIFTTNVTKALTDYMLKDSAKVMEKEAEKRINFLYREEQMLREMLNRINRLKKLIWKIDKKNKNYRKFARQKKQILSYSTKTEIADEIAQLEEKLQNFWVTHRKDIDQNYKQKKLKEQEEVLYTYDDIDKLLSITRWKKFYDRFEIFPGIYLTFFKAAHILWSAQILLEIDKWDGTMFNMWFSGDLWRYDNVNLLWIPDNDFPISFDFFQTESTYWWKPKHTDRQKDMEKMWKLITEIMTNKWKIIIPAYMLQRLQDKLYNLVQLKQQWLIPQNTPIFYDWWIIDNINNVFKIYDVNWVYTDLFTWQKVKKIHNNNWFNEFLSLKKTWWILVAPSWMLNWWTIMRYLKEIAPFAKNAIFFVGYQAEWTLWYQIAIEWLRRVRVDDLSVLIKARVYKFHSFSSHADEDDLLYHLSGLKFSKNATLMVHHWDLETSQTVLRDAILKEKILDKKQVKLATLSDVHKIL